MAWTLRISDTAKRKLKKLDRSTAQTLLRYLNRLLVETETPRQRGKALTASLAGLWRYRVGDYRLVCDLQDGELVVLVLQVGHRREVYRRAASRQGPYPAKECRPASEHSGRPHRRDA